MAFGGKKAKGFNLDCILGNVSVTVVTCCGFIFQGTIEDDENTRAQYGCPVVFPAMTMEYDHEHKDEYDCKDDDKKDHKKPVEVDVDVKCTNDPKFLCLRLECIPTFVCCDPTTAIAALILPVGTPPAAGTTGIALPLFQEDDTVLISLSEIAAIGPSRTCFATV